MPKVTSASVAKPKGDRVYDFVIVGSGAAAVCAAMVMKEAGKTALIIEKREFFGGSTALSGGVIWVPGNSLQSEAGVEDSPAMARAYLDACAGPYTKGSSAARRKAFLTAAPLAIDFLRANGLKLEHATGYSDYHEGEKPGGLAGGRALVPEIFNLKDLGRHRIKIDSSREIPPVQAHAIGHLTRFGRDWVSFKVLAKTSWRMLQNTLLRRQLAGFGASLQGRLLQMTRQSGIRIWLNSPVAGLISDGGRVTGVQALHKGKEVRVTARQGVLINAGGFARSAKMREHWLAQPQDAAWTVSNEGDTGEVMRMAVDLGAQVEAMDQCWWVPGSFPPEGGTALHVNEQARPHAIIVDRRGQRFTNEAASYVKIGRDFYRHNQDVPCIPAWLIVDSRHRKRYAFGMARPGKVPKAWLDSGYMKKADSLADLAQQCGLPADGLQATVNRFNQFASDGKDPDFGRGAGAYAKFLGDPRNKPNPSLGTIEKGPFYAVQLFPRDVGTSGGLVTNEDAQVLDGQGQPIRGLYATGNSTASVHGPSYPGPGASISASLAFGFIAARHAVRTNWREASNAGPEPFILSISEHEDVLSLSEQEVVPENE
jgi:3-oxosteroid 1-dehydrogenase